MRYLLDTNVLREISKPTPHQNVAAWFKTVGDSDLAISALSVREMTTGVAKLRRAKPQVARALEAIIMAIFEAFEGRTLPIDRAVAAAWGEALARSGKHVDDAGLAATASVHGLTVVTRNVLDFQGRGVDVLDPFKSRPPGSAGPRGG